MKTIYSKIIWEELGLKDYEIHKEPCEKTESLIIDWVKNNTSEKIEQVIAEISWVHDITDEDYYDGQFYGITQRDKEEQKKSLTGKAEPDLIIHDTGLFPSMLLIAMKTGFPSDEFIFMAKILEAYYEKLEKNNTCKT